MRMFMLATVLALAPPTGHVNDRAGLLSPNGAAAMESELRTYQVATTNQIAVLTLPDLGGEDIKAVANLTFHAWGIGERDKNNGVLLLVAKAERKVRIEVGYGLEPYLTDGRSGQIIRDDIVPRFRAGDFEGGIEAAVRRIMEVLPRVSEPAVAASDDSGPWVLVFILVGLAVGVALVVALVRRRNKREAQRAADVAKTTTVTPSAYVGRYEAPTYVRARRPMETPRYADTTVVVVPDYSSSSRSSSSDDSGSSSSSSWGSSSDSGGSFGGGDSGGGGADGSW